MAREVGGKGEKALARRETPGPVRSFVHGVAVSASEVHRPSLGTTAIGSGVTFFGGLVTMLVGSPDTFHWNGPTDAGVAIMGTVAAGWAAYGATKGGAAAGRHFVERGRSDYRRRGVG